MTFAQSVSTMIGNLGDLVMPRPHDGEVRISTCDFETFQARDGLAIRVSLHNLGAIHGASVCALAPEVCIPAPSYVPGQPLTYLLEMKVDGQASKAIIKEPQLATLIENCREQVRIHGKVQTVPFEKVFPAVF